MDLLLSYQCMFFFESQLTCRHVINKNFLLKVMQFLGSVYPHLYVTSFISSVIFGVQEYDQRYYQHMVQNFTFNDGLCTLEVLTSQIAFIKHYHIKLTTVTWI